MLKHAAAAFKFAGNGTDPSENALAAALATAAWLTTKAAEDRNQSTGPVLLHAAQTAVKAL
jgi:hypothetical protein